jgi:hypothetical protein
VQNLPKKKNKIISAFYPEALYKREFTTTFPIRIPIMLGVLVEIPIRNRFVMFFLHQAILDFMMEIIRNCFIMQNKTSGDTFQ